MKSNRIIWGVVSLVVLITIAISFGTMTSHSQKDDSKEQDKNPFGDLSKYPVAEFDAPEPKDVIERQERFLRNKRYDKQFFVSKKPNPETIRIEVTHGEPIPCNAPR